MEQTLEEVLVEAIQKTQGGIEKGVDFALSQAPDLVQQALAWHFTVSALSMGLLLVLMGIMSYVEMKLFKKFTERHDRSFIVLFSCFFVVIASLILFSLDWLKIWIAPKLWLLEYAAGLIE